jgi:hypothetical protein
MFPVRKTNLRRNFRKLQRSPDDLFIVCVDRLPKKEAVFLRKPAKANRALAVILQYAQS